MGIEAGQAVYSNFPEHLEDFFLGARDVVPGSFPF